jgi:hypothetical protein
MVKSFVILPMVANWNTAVIYCGTAEIKCGILTLENEGTVVNYSSIFITLAQGLFFEKFTAVIYGFS